MLGELLVRTRERCHTAISRPATETLLSTQSTWRWYTWKDDAPTPALCAAVSRSASILGSRKDRRLNIPDATSCDWAVGSVWLPWWAAGGGRYSYDRKPNPNDSMCAAVKQKLIVCHLWYIVDNAPTVDKLFCVDK